MDERARLILSEAFATIERSEAERDELLADIAQRQADEVIYGNGTRVPNSKTMSAHRIDDGGLIYKTTRQPEAAPTMDEQTLARWNEWFDDRFARSVQKHLEDFASIIGEHTGEAEKHL